MVNDCLMDRIGEIIDCYVVQYLYFKVIYLLENIGVFGKLRNIVIK